MTKMPDKIYVTIGRGSDDVILQVETYPREFLGENTEYTRSDLIPQPVTSPTPLVQEPEPSGLTDEANTLLSEVIRAKALDALDEISECINSILTLAERNGVTEVAKWKFKDQCKTIRAALSQPIPMQSKDIQKETNHGNKSTLEI